VTNLGGSVTSSVAALRLRPAIAEQPVSTTNVIGANASFVASAAGTAPLAYQWLFNGAPVTGATANKYSLTVSAASPGNYSLVVTSSYGATISSVVTLTLPPVLTPTVTWPVASGITYGQVLAESTLSDGGASVDGSFGFAAPLTAPNAGSYSASVIFTPLDQNLYGSVTGAVWVAVAKATPTVTTWPTATALVYGNTLSLSSLTGGSASVGGTFVFNAASMVPDAGTCSAVVDFIPTAAANYHTVSSSVNVSVAQAVQTITLQPLATNSIPLNQFTDPIPVVATASSSLPVTITLDSGSAAVLTETNTLVNVGAVGTVTLHANQAGNNNYLAAAEVTASLDVTKVNQAITNFAAIADQAATNPPITLNAAASSTLTVAFTVLDGPATVSGNLLTLTGAGTVVVQAAQAGNAIYNAAMTTNHTFQVSAIASSLTWGTLPVVTYGDSPLTLNAVSSSGLTVTYSSSDTTVATIAGNTMTITGAGTCSIIALDAGNAFYTPATDSRTLTVNKATPSLTLPTASAITYGEHLSDSSLTGGNVSLHGNNVPSYIGFNSATDPAPLAGDYLTTVLATPDDMANFTTVTGTVTVTVSPAGTTITLDSSANPSLVGDAVTLTATVSSSAASGTVTFKDGVTTLGTGALSDGLATFTANGLAVGSHSLRAEYGGDANYAASVSSALTQKVNATCAVVRNGLWSAPATWSCGRVPEAGTSVTIGAGFTVELDSDTTALGNVTLDGTLTVPGAQTLTVSGNFINTGTFTPGTGTVLLTGGTDQTLAATAPGTLTFYKLTVNKDPATVTVTAASKLKASKKLTLTKGKLISASDYGDVFIESAGTLELTSNITVSGNFTNNGTLTTGGYGITFDGGVEQNLSLLGATVFDNLTVAAGTTLIETDSNDNAVVSGTLVNHGVIRKTQSVAANSDYYFGLAGDSGAGLVIDITSRAGADPLTAIRVDRVDSTPPHAPGTNVTGIYWTLTATGSGFTATLILPQAGLANPQVCRYRNSVWNWGQTSHDASTITWPGLTAFGEFAVYNPQGTPPTSRNPTASITANHPLVLALDKLLAMASDPDPGDTLTVTTAGPTSTHGPVNNVVLNTGAGIITYTPETGYTGSDTFTYTVSDIFGLTVTPTVTVTVTAASGAPPNVVSPPIYTNGAFRVTFAGIPGLVYRIQQAPTPTGDWTDLTTATAAANGLFQLIDESASAVPARYYRTVYP
jgi:hypothetical protein